MRTLAMGRSPAHRATGAGIGGTADHAAAFAIAVDVIDEDDDVAVILMDHLAAYLLTASPDCVGGAGYGMGRRRSQGAKPAQGTGGGKQQQGS